MFTGIIEDLGKIEKITGKNIVLSTNLDNIKTGDSVSVNGICLTSTKTIGNKIGFDVSPETARKSNFSKLKAGDFVNLERAMYANSRFGGHIVLGHIEGTGKVTKITHNNNDFFEFYIEINRELMPYIALKGSIAVDGISLTIAEINENSFMTAIVPLTFKNTSLSHKKIGDLVNIETDILAKYIENIVKYHKKYNKLTANFLKENGFI
ncbi:MAG: riboflavin synthase [Elusimicrobia bacterium]|nr:riboflavin synthase [Candidatus Liberimonas magnetica]